MNKRQTWLLYALTLLVAVIFFVFHLFPGEKIDKHVRLMFVRAFPEFELSIEKTRPALPLGIRLSGVKVIRADNVVFETDFVKIGFPIGSIFSGKTSFSFNGRVYGGKATGIIQVMENAARATADVELSGIRIEKIPAIGQITQSDISGALNGSLTVDSAASSGQAEVKLRINDLAASLPLPFIKSGNLIFKAVEMEASLNRPDFVITQCTFKGKQLDGQMTGKMTLKNPFEESMLNLEGTIQPHPEFLKNFPIQMLPPRQKNNNGFGFKLSGTFAKPGFSFR
jgi:type II secretion system protein N